jgi:hypothetical protein
VGVVAVLTVQDCPAPVDLIVRKRGSRGLAWFRLSIAPLDPQLA